MPVSFLLPILIALLLPSPLYAGFSENSLPGLYRRRAGIDGEPRCGDLFRFSAPGPSVPASKISFDNVKCEGGDLMLTLNPKDGDQGLIKLFSIAKSQAGDFYTGSLIERIACGAVAYGVGTVFIFVNPDNDLTVSWADVLGPGTALETDTASVFTFRKGVPYIIINRRCLYIRDDSDPVKVNDGSVCMPAGARVQVEDVGMVAIESLNIGDRVLVGRGVYSEVFAWTHREFGKAIEWYAGIDVGLERRLIVTYGHIVYVNGQAVRAREVKVGDVMRGGDGEELVVRGVERVKGRGLFNPQTVQGNIVVEGVVVSTYTETVEREVAHALLAPVRAAFQSFGWVGLVDRVAELVLRGQNWVYS